MANRLFGRMMRLLVLGGALLAITLPASAQGGGIACASNGECPATIDTLSLDSSFITAGGCTHIRWESTYATHGTLSGDFFTNIPPDGSWEVCPPSTQVYTIEMFYPGGLRQAGYDPPCSVQASIILTVMPPVLRLTPTPTLPRQIVCPPAVITDWWADQLTIEVGHCTDIHWTIVDAIARTFETEGVPGSDFPIPPSGSHTVCPTVTTMYRLRAYGDVLPDGRSCGDDTHTINITVRGVPLTPELRTPEFGTPEQREPGEPGEPEGLPEVCEDWMVFHTDRDGNWELYQLDVSGADELVNLTHNEEVDIAPSRSPDSEWVAFQSMRDGNWEIYIVQVDDPTVQLRMTVNTASDVRPVWGLGTHIVYQSDRDGNWSLYDLDVATGVSAQLTDQTSNEVNPYWSPDGQKIVFQSDPSVLGGPAAADFNLYILDIASGAITPLVTDPGQDVYPIWSPDGAHIAFLSNRTPTGEPGGVFGLYMVNADGSGQLRMSPDYGESVSDPVWSPDGTRIAFAAALETVQREIYVVEIATGVLLRVTENALEDYAPTWFCFGNDYLVFTEETTPEQPDLFIAPAAQPIQPPSAVVTSLYRDVYPLWSPRYEIGPYRVSLHPFH
jgi:TolB protein